MRKSAVLLFVIVFLIGPCVIVSVPVKAGSKIIVVPDDYSTIGEAVSAASEGDVIFVKEGAYNEQTLTVNKTLSLKGERAKDTVITFHPPLLFGGYPVSVVPSYSYDKSLRIYANDVEISGFTISAELTTQTPADLANHTLGPCDPPFVIMGGAQVQSTGNNTKITGNTITLGLLIEGSNQTIEGNTLASGAECTGFNNKVVSNLVTGSGISVGGAFNEIHANNIIGSYKIDRGILVTGNGTIIAGNNVTNCKGGLVVYCGYIGVGANSVFYGNRVVQNVYGIVVSGGSNNTFFGNELLNSSIGVKFESPNNSGGQSETNATFHHNNFIGSAQQVSMATSHFGFFDTGSEGNYWSDYNGVDSDGDGIGDTSYLITGKLSDGYPLMAPFDISSATISDAFPETRHTEPLSAVPVVAASVAAVVVICAGVLVYFKKRKREVKQQ